MANSNYELREYLWDENEQSIMVDKCELRPITLTVNVGDISASQLLYVHKCDDKPYHISESQEQKEEYLNTMTPEEIQADNNVYFVHD